MSDVKITLQTQTYNIHIILDVIYTIQVFCDVCKYMLLTFINTSVSCYTHIGDDILRTSLNMSMSLTCAINKEPPSNKREASNELWLFCVCFIPLKAFNCKY